MLEIAGRRINIGLLIMAGMIIAAAILQVTDTPYLDGLIQYESVRSLFHIVLFFIITYLVAGHSSSLRLPLLVILIGGILVEMVQYLAVGVPLATWELQDSTFDLFADFVGGSAALKVMVLTNHFQTPEI